MAVDGLPRPDHGPGFRERVCADCGASWVGDQRDGAWCPWCEASWSRQRAEERALLLDPPWLRRSDGDPRYDELDPLDRAVWERTRGQCRDHDARAAYHHRLVRAVETGLLRADEARAAWTRVEGGRYRRYPVTAASANDPHAGTLSVPDPPEGGNTSGNAERRVTARVTADGDTDTLLSRGSTVRGNGVTGVTGGSR